MRASRSLAWVIGTSLMGLAWIGHWSTFRAVPPFPPLAVTLSSPVTPLSDFIGIALGFRSLTADLAWIQTLVYYGTVEEGADPEEAERGGGHYPLFLAYCQRVAQIDPGFKYVFYYGAGVLGWNLNRPDEAEQLLRQGIAAHPKEWRFQQYLAAMAFQKSHNINKLIEFLEGFVQERDCPNILRSILANIYKKQHRYKDAIRVWFMVNQTQDPSYMERSVTQIQELYTLLQAEKAGK